MARPKTTSPAQLPAFRTDADERKFWETHDPCRGQSGLPGTREDPQAARRRTREVAYRGCPSGEDRFVGEAARVPRDPSRLLPTFRVT